jgi:arylsulfatase A-like enzyme
VLHVPLVMRLPGQCQGRREPAPVSHVDLMPTLLELAGVDPGPDLDGRSLLGAVDPDRSVAAYLDLDGWGGWSVVRGGHHAIRHQRLGYTGPAELYDVAGDPEEHRDRSRDLGVTAGTLIDEARRETLDEAGRYQTAPAAIDDDLRHRLEALGYL